MCGTCRLSPTSSVSIGKRTTRAGDGAGQWDTIPVERAAEAKKNERKDSSSVGLCLCLFMRANAGGKPGEWESREDFRLVPRGTVDVEAGEGVGISILFFMLYITCKDAE